MSNSQYQPIPTRSPIASPVKPASKSTNQSLNQSLNSTDDPAIDQSIDEELSQWAMVRLCIPVIPSQLGWAVGEALLIPYMMSLGLAETSANAIWLINPIVGFFVSPLIGTWSDQMTSSWGKRRPFLFLFHFGIICGLLMIGFAPEIHSMITNSPMYNEQGHASILLLIIIFTGCVVMELSNDLLTIPSRALLNDLLPESQVEAGNAWFSAMNSLGAVIGLTMCFLPLNSVWPLSLLDTQLRATFVACIACILTSNAFTMTIEEWSEEDEDDLDLIKSTNQSINQSNNQSHKIDHVSPPVSAMASPDLESGNGQTIDESLDESINQSIDDTEDESDEKPVDPDHMGMIDSMLAFRQLSPVLKAIWFAQFSWWLVVMQGSFWWTTWVGIAVYGGDPMDNSEVFYEGVTYGIISTLVHAIVSFFASQILTFFNRKFGVTRVYHGSAVIYSILTMALWQWRTKNATMWYMIVTGILYPVINTNPFILIEVYTGYDDEDEGEEETVDTASPKSTNQSTNQSSNQSVDQTAIQIDDDSAIETSSGNYTSDDDTGSSMTSSMDDSDFMSDTGFHPPTVTDYLYDLERSINEHAYSDSEAEDRANQSINLDADPSINQSIDLSTVLPLAISSTVNDVTDGRTLSPLVSPGMVATVVEQARAANIFEDLSINQSMNQSINQSIDQSTLMKDRKPSRVARFLLDGEGGSPYQPSSRSTYQSANQSSGQSRSVYQSSHQSTNQSISQSRDHSAVLNMDVSTTTPSFHAFISQQIEAKTAESIDSDDANQSLNQSISQSIDEVEEELEEAEAVEAEYLKASTHRGILTAIMNLSMGLSQIISATLGGLLISYYGDITIVFLVSAIFCLIVNVIVMGYGLSGSDIEVDSEEVAPLISTPVDEALNARLIEQQNVKREKERKERERIIRGFLHERDEVREPGYGSTVGTPIAPLLRRRKQRKDEEMPLTVSTSLPNQTVSQLVNQSAKRKTKFDINTIDLADRKRAQSWLMQALAQMSIMHKDDAKKRTRSAVGPRPTAIPSSTQSINQPFNQSKSARFGPTENTPLVDPLTPLQLPRTMDQHNMPSFDISTNQSINQSVNPSHPRVHPMLTHPSHRRLLYEITVLLHYYHVPRIDLLPVAIQDKIHIRLHAHLHRHRSLLKAHHRIDADIASRRSLPGRYATPQEIESERERLQLKRKQRRKRKAQEFKQREQEMQIHEVAHSP